MNLLEGYKIIAVDFDGTITTEPHIKEKMEIRPYCKDVLQRLSEVEDVRLVLWTCREGKALDRALSFLEKNELLQVFDSVNEQIPEIFDKYYPDVGKKVGADLYIDDKHILTEDEIDWKVIEELIKVKLNIKL